MLTTNKKYRLYQWTHYVLRQRVCHLLSTYYVAHALLGAFVIQSLNPQPPLKIEIISILHTRELKPKEIKNLLKVRRPVWDTIKPMFFLPYIKQFVKGRKEPLWNINSNDGIVGFLLPVSALANVLQWTYYFLWSNKKKIFLISTAVTTKKKPPSCFPFYSLVEFSCKSLSTDCNQWIHK